MRTPNLQRGFTAIEIMVVVLIVGIMAGFAAPAMNQLIRTQKVRGAAYDIFSDLTYARGEAIARGHNVLVASAGNTDWATGWAIRDTTSGEVLRTQNALSTGLVFTADAGSLTFDRSGRTTVAMSFSIKPTDSGVPDTQKRCVRISPSGRPNSLTGPCP
jgi:type IV fimbrial biogenesis protein FimT